MGAIERVKEDLASSRQQIQDMHEEINGADHGSAATTGGDSDVSTSSHLSEEQETEIKDAMVEAAKEAVSQAKDKTREIAQDNGVDQSTAQKVATDAVRDAA